MAAGRAAVMTGAVTEVSRPPSDDPLAAIVDTLVGKLEALAEKPGTRFTCDDLVEVIGPRAHSLSLLIFALLSQLPGPPGYNVLLGLLIFALALLWTFQRPIRLWPIVGHRRLPLKALVKLLGVLRWVIGLVARLSTPRLTALVSGRAVLPLGLFSILMGTIMLFPIPFTNMLPSFAVALLSIGVLNRDGALAILGVVVGIVGAVFFAWAVQLLISLLYAVDVALTGV